MMNMPLQKTSDMDAVIISDSEDDQAGPAESSDKRRRLDAPGPRMQYQRYHFLGPQAWQLILQNMLDCHTDAPEHLKREVVPWSSSTPLFVVATMARRDALDLTKAWPKIMKQHPHIKLHLIMMVATGELEATETACLRRLSDLYAEGSYTMPGITPVPMLPDNWEQDALKQVHQENLEKIQQHGPLETVEMLHGRPVVTEALKKFINHREFGSRIRELVARHELEWCTY